MQVGTFRTKFGGRVFEDQALARSRVVLYVLLCVVDLMALENYNQQNNPEEFIPKQPE